MKKYILVIEGDTNDADYVEAKHEFDSDTNIHIDAIKGHTVTFEPVYYHIIDFMQMLAKVLNMPRVEQHNWTRDEWDRNDNAVRETIAKLFEEIYGSKIESLDDENEEDFEYSESAHQYLRSVVEAYLPYSEDGIHTIERIIFYEKPDVTVIF